MRPGVTAERTLLGRARLSERAVERRYTPRMPTDLDGITSSVFIRRTARSDGPDLSDA